MKVNIIINKGRKIHCEFYKKRNAKNLRLSVDSSGIVKVSIPYYVSYTQGKSFVNDNLDWIEKKLKLSNLQKKSYNYLGNDIHFTKIISNDIKDLNYKLSGNKLVIFTNDTSCSNKDLYHKWLYKKAKDYIPNRVEYLSKKYDFKYNSIKIKNLTSQWGSCSDKKNLSFNLKLMYFNHKVIDYVLIHELCHLKVMNHSQRFWDRVEAILPNYRVYRELLNNFTQI